MGQAKRADILAGLEDEIGGLGEKQIVYGGLVMY